MTTACTEQVTTSDGGTSTADCALPGQPGRGIQLLQETFGWDAPSMYDQPAAEAAWATPLAFLGEHLR